MHQGQFAVAQALIAVAQLEARSPLSHLHPTCNEPTVVQ